ncbi:hypothetical protein [Pseudomonas sp. EA_35y_Pfl2_R5]|uniref:hypothetical protein n=1 Tax=Pseudomonas sp. EA_35y_Pfl2_R5 TaxID=3088690 RepID=UPI0030DAC84E
MAGEGANFKGIKDGRIGKKRAFYSAWLAATLVFAVMLFAVMTEDGGLDQAKIAVGSVVLLIASVLIRAYFKNEFLRDSRP